MKCRHCGAEVRLPLVDLGTSPPSNDYVSASRLSAGEYFIPLRIYICENCWLVQTEDFAASEDMFAHDYAYFSGFSTAWLNHSEAYANQMISQFKLNAQLFVVEVASNDGYLLQYFQQKGIPCLGIEPTSSTAQVARAKGIDVVEEFFGERLAARLVDEGRGADLIAANNVLAHVPDINDFVRGFSVLLKPSGVATFEFPHLVQMIAQSQFDTIYHEHFSYLSLSAVKKIFEANGLAIFDVEELSTHGGSLRVYAQRADLGRQVESERVNALLLREQELGVCTSDYYIGFQARAQDIKYDLLRFLLDARRKGETVGAYGAAAKGNTLLNFSGIRADLIPWVVDRNPAKQGKFLPGSRIPIVNEDRLKAEKPDYIIILPWNLRDEVMAQLSYVRDWGGKFVTAIPSIAIL